MHDWKRAKLSEVTNFQIGGTPARNIPSYWADKPLGFPWLSIADLKGKYLSDTEEYISELGASSSNVKLIPQGTTVMSFKLTVGRTGIVTRPMYCNEAIAFFHPKPQYVDSHWLYYELPRASKRVVTDTAVKGSTLNKQKIGELPFDLPPIQEQRVIAQILDTLDTQIRRTEQVIAKLEQIKQGLLADLLTRGIDENGELRPPPEEAPELYRNSPIGWIPKAWDIDSMRTIATKITDGTHQAVSTVPRSGNTVPFLFVSSIRNGKILWDSAAAISQRAFQEISRGREPVEGMVLYTAVGSYGHAAVVEDEQLFAFQRHIACIYPKKPLAIGAFIAAYLNSPVARSQADRIALGNAQKTITLGELANFPIPRPSTCEQDRILKIIGRQDARVQREIDLMSKLRTTKNGIMDDLLTGRVRVTPLLDGAPRATG